MQRRGPLEGLEPRPGHHDLILRDRHEAPRRERPRARRAGRLRRRRRRRTRGAAALPLRARRLSRLGGLPGRRERLGQRQRPAALALSELADHRVHPRRRRRGGVRGLGASGAVLAARGEVEEKRGYDACGGFFFPFSRGRFRRRLSRRARRRRELRRGRQPWAVEPAHGLEPRLPHPAEALMAPVLFGKGGQRGGGRGERGGGRGSGGGRSASDLELQLEPERLGRRGGGSSSSGRERPASEDVDL